jgi:GTP-binding protein YchF
MKIGIIGLPNVGKSSLFNLLTTAHAQVADFPFTTIDRNIGMAPIFDKRLLNIAKITQSAKVTCAQIEYVDIAGLIKGASHGEGLGNTFLAHIRDVDLILHVIRCFSDPNIPHIDTIIAPDRDYDIVRTELYLSDLELIERRMEKMKKNAEKKEEYGKLKKIQESLAQGKTLKNTTVSLPLISCKPEIIVLNVDENKGFQSSIDGYYVSVKLEYDIIDMGENEKRELRSDINVEASGLVGLVEQCCKKLSLITFYTIKGDETKAWLVPDKTRVQEAAGKIHSDMERGFIKAEVISYDVFMTGRGFSPAQHIGKARIEGRDYIVQDGDIILVKFKA